MKLRHIYKVVAIILLLMQTLLALFSWVAESVFPQLGLRSLLSGDGIRWTLGHFSNHVSTPLLLWVILVASGVEVMKESGLWQLLCMLLSRKVRRSQLSYRERFAFQMVIVIILVSLAVVFLLTCLPEAVLLSVTGSLLDGIFLSSLVPLLFIIVCAMSLVYGYFGGKTPTTDSMFASLHKGISDAAPLILLYVMAAVLWYSFIFVLD